VKNTTIIMGEDKFHFAGDKLNRMTRIEPKAEHFCAFPGCTNLVRNYKHQVKDCCSSQHGRLLIAEKTKIKTGLRDPLEIIEALEKHDCYLKHTAKYFNVHISVLRERMYEFGIEVKRIVVMDDK